MRATRELGLKVTAAQREYYRYTGPSAEAERSGAGFSHPERTWIGCIPNAQIPDSPFSGATPDSPNRSN